MFAYDRDLGLLCHRRRIPKKAQNVTDSTAQPSKTTGQRRAVLLKATCFRPVVGGYIYRAPSLWIFGRADNYLVTASQQDAIIGVPGTPNRCAGGGASAAQSARSFARPFSPLPM